ncbi:YfbU family protein [Leifsonia sp. NPDC102414]|uniref:YfbU family protein n=1 Tax=Leifsonia sp. NPDC102414 TaxID=3364124 RepID=UPI0037FC339A
MPTLNVRLDDDLARDLRMLAESEKQSMSEMVRDAVAALVRPVVEVERGRPGDERAPESLRFMDRKVLAMLHRILALAADGDTEAADGDRVDHLQRAKVLERGFAGEYWGEAAGFATELSHRDCDRVFEIMDMFRTLNSSMLQLEVDGSHVGDDLNRSLTFGGFDHNDGLEGHMADYVKYLTETDRYTDLIPAIESHDRGNSHMRMLDVYSRMLAVYRPIWTSRSRGYPDGLLSIEELKQIAAARVHPSNR